MHTIYDLSQILENPLSVRGILNFRRAKAPGPWLQPIPLDQMFDEAGKLQESSYPQTRQASDSFILSSASPDPNAHSSPPPHSSLPEAQTNAPAQI